MNKDEMMNALVAEQVMGWTPLEPGMFEDDNGTIWVISPEWTPRTPHKRFMPSTDHNAAFQVVEKMLSSKKYDFELYGWASPGMPDEGFDCYFKGRLEHALTAPLAICRTALATTEGE